MCCLLCLPGVPAAFRHLAALEKPRITIKAQGERVSIRTESSLKTTEISFRLGEVFDETTADNRKVKVRIRLPSMLQSGRN